MSARRARAFVLWCALLLASAHAYTVDCNHEYTDCDTELSKITAEDEEAMAATTPKIKETTPSFRPTIPPVRIPKVEHRKENKTAYVEAVTLPYIPEVPVEMKQVPETQLMSNVDPKHKPRLLNLNVDELQNFANALHNQTNGKGPKKHLSDLSDVNLDGDEEEESRMMPIEHKNKEISDKFYTNLQAPFHSLINPDRNSEEMDTCKENEMTYKIGDHMDRGCDETCECSSGGIFECSPRCKPPYIRRGRRLSDPLCFESPVDDCCSIIACATGNGDMKVTKLEMCRYGNDTHPIGSKWNIGCEQTCSCEPNYVVTCKPRCNPLPVSDKCINVQDPNDACCEVQVCDVSHDDHEEPENVTTSTTTTTTESIKGFEDYDSQMEHARSRPLVLAEPIGSVKVLQNNSVQVNLMHMNKSEDPIHLLLSNDGGRSFNDVELKYSNLILNLEGGRDYILKTKETGTKFNFTITATDNGPNEIIIPKEEVHPPNATKVGCYHDGVFYAVGEEFHIGCEQLCECTGQDTRECAALICPSHVGLELVSKGCVRWAPSPPANPPNCCPRSARCLSDGTCHYKGVAIPNWSEVPIPLTGCEQRCFCENGELDCQEVCSPLPPVPPQNFRCPPNHRPAAVNISDEDCCKQWGCVPNAGNDSAFQNYGIYNVGDVVNYVTPVAPVLPTTLPVLPSPPITTDSIDFYRHLSPVKSFPKYMKTVFPATLVPKYEYVEHSPAPESHNQPENVTVYNPEDVDSPYKNVHLESNLVSMNNNINNWMPPEKPAQIFRPTESFRKPQQSFISQNSENQMKPFMSHNSENQLQPFTSQNSKSQLPPFTSQNLKKQLQSFVPQKTENQMQSFIPQHPGNQMNSFIPQNSANKMQSFIPQNTENQIQSFLTQNSENQIQSSLLQNSESQMQSFIAQNTENQMNRLSNENKVPEYFRKPESVTETPDQSGPEKITLKNFYESVRKVPISKIDKINYFLPSVDRQRPPDSSYSNYYGENAPINPNSGAEAVHPGHLPPALFEPTTMVNRSVEYSIPRVLHPQPLPNPNTARDKPVLRKQVTILKTKDLKNTKPTDLHYSGRHWNEESPAHVLTKLPNPYETVLLRAVPNSKIHISSSRFNSNPKPQMTGKTYTALDLEHLLNQMEVESVVNKNLGRSADKGDINEGQLGSDSPQETFLPTVSPEIHFPNEEIGDYDQNNIHRPATGVEPALAGLPPGLTLPAPYGDSNKKLSVISLQSDSPTSVKMLFGLPTVLVGLRGSVDLRYTDKADEDISHWFSQVFAPADEVLTTPRLEFRLTGLKPGTTYKIKGKLYLHNLPVEPESEVYSVRTHDLPKPPVLEEKRREINSRLAVSEVNDTTAHVSWRHFDEQDLLYIDAIQVRYRPVGTPIYSMTELLHHSRSAIELQDLRPDTKYEASLVLVPPPKATTELVDPTKVEFTTVPYVDPYNWTVTIETRSVGAGAAEVWWGGVPAPTDRWVRVFRAAHACNPTTTLDRQSLHDKRVHHGHELDIHGHERERLERDAFRLADRDLPPAIKIHGLMPDTKCRVWLELFLTNGKVKTSNVLEINTKSLDRPEPIDNEIESSSSVSGRHGDYYGALVGVGAVAALGALTSLLLLLVVLRRHRPRSVPITTVPSAPRESSLPPYDNPAYKLELQQETMDL